MQQITKAMKMVAAARLRKSQEQVLAARPYAQKMREIFLSIMEQSSQSDHPLFEDRGDERVLYIVLTAERGLCGAFNANVMKRAINTEEERVQRKREAVAEQLGSLDLPTNESSPDDNRELPEVEIAEAMWIPVGSKGRDFLGFRGYNIVKEFVNITDVADRDLAEEISDVAVRYFEAGEVDSVYVIYSQFISVMQQRPAAFKLLPLVRPEFEDATEQVEAQDQPDTEYIERWLPGYTYEPNSELVLHHLIPKYLETVVLHALLETRAGEFGARMTAMDSATKNAGEVIESLTLEFNQARQAAITQELTEIVSGAGALQ